ncbi:MAG: 2-isopropylmalate synthase [Desulfurococcaceae archaeon]|nr:2-isopropylmalate synthase [Desulfurococcaceae archaeon]
MRLLDTTLRDGEQMPGVDLSVDQKLEIALLLDELGVDSIEAGFPITSRGEFEAVKLIAKNVGNSEVVALARTRKEDIDKALDADVDAIHTFIATSDIHMKYKLKMTREQVVEKAIEAVEYAKSHGVVVEFSAEDATRSDWGFLVKVFQGVVDAGADRLDIADTVGVMRPSYMVKLVEFVRNNVKGNYILSVHCHNDFGMAVANSVSAVEAGADQVHVTVLGVGERAGNAALEEVASALKFLLGYEVGIKFEKIRRVADVVAKHFNIAIPPNKAIIGANAFAHESGIHVHGILSHPLTYEPIDPSIVGAQRIIVLGKHSGRHAVEYVLKQLGIEPRNDIVEEVLKIVKDLGDRGIKIDKQLLESIIMNVVKKVELDVQGSGY